METPDVQIGIYVAIRQFLESDDTWKSTFAVGNRIWFDDQAGVSTPDKPNTNDQDYPMAKLDGTGGTNNLYSSDETFETHSPEGPSHWLEDATYKFRLRLISQKVSQREISRLDMISVNALRKGGPRLGLSYVTRVRLTWETKITTDSDSDEDEMIRYRTDVFISVETQTDGSTLIGD